MDILWFHHRFHSFVGNFPTSLTSQEHSQSFFINLFFLHFHSFKVNRSSAVSNHFLYPLFAFKEIGAMRSSTFFAVAAAIATASAGTTTVVPVQQIADGQIQNPVLTPAPPAPSSYAAPPAPAPTTSVVASAAAPSVAAPPAPPASAPSAPPPAPPAPTVIKPSGAGVPPSYGNVTKTASKSNTVTVVKPSAPPAGSPSTSKPSVQTAGASTLVGSTVGLSFAAFLAVLFG